MERMNRLEKFLLDATSIKHAAKYQMKSLWIAATTVIIGLTLIFTAHAQTLNQAAQVTVFQAAGPNVSSIQSAVDQFRVALGGTNNGNTAGPIETGRREINWDGGGSTATSLAPTPFDGFLIGRGARFTGGSGFVQATPSGLAD